MSIKKGGQTVLGSFTNTTGFVKEENITTTIDSSSTDDTVPSAKTMYEESIHGKLVDDTVIATYGTEIIKYPLGRWYFNSTSKARQFSDIPWNEACIIDISSIGSEKNSPWDKEWQYRNYSARTISGCGNYTRQIESGSTAGVLKVDTGWQRVCTTNVTDVAKKSLSATNTDTTYYDINSSNSFYSIKNGICVVNLVVSCNSVNSNWVTMIEGVLPKPVGQLHFSIGNMYNTNLSPLYALVKTDGVLCLRIGGVTSGTNYYWLSFSYPVA